MSQSSRLLFLGRLEVGNMVAVVGSWVSAEMLAIKRLFRGVGVQTECAGCGIESANSLSRQDVFSGQLDQS